MCQQQNSQRKEQKHSQKHLNAQQRISHIKRLTLNVAPVAISWKAGMSVMRTSTSSSVSSDSASTMTRPAMNRLMLNTESLEQQQVPGAVNVSLKFPDCFLTPESNPFPLYSVALGESVWWILIPKIYNTLSLYLWENQQLFLPVSSEEEEMVQSQLTVSPGLMTISVGFQTYPRPY